MDQTREIIYKEIMEFPENKNLVEYVSKFIKLSKEGTRYIGRCPFCNRENRLTVFEDSWGLQLLGMYATIRTPWKGVER